MAKLMSYKRTGLGSASRSFKRTTRKVDRFRKSKESDITRKKQRAAKEKVRAQGKEPIKGQPIHEAKEYRTYSPSGARAQKMKLEKKGYKVKTIKTGSGIFTEYNVFTDKPLPKEKYWD